MTSAEQRAVTAAPADGRQPPRVFVTRQLPGDALEHLRRVAEVDVWPGELPPPPEELRAHASGATALVTLVTDRVDAALLDAAPALRIVANVAVGYDNLDLAELARRHVAASNTPDVLTEATADLAFALILAAGRRLGEARDLVRAGGWKTWDPRALLGLELAGATLGVVGFGRIGRAVARRAAGFGMEVVVNTPSARPADAATTALREAPALPAARPLPLEALLRSADVVSLHCPLTPATFHLIGARELEMMKPTAVLVNTARGQIVDQRALAAALGAGEIAAAGLDVTEVEPIAPDDPLIGLENCIVLPHIGSATTVTRSRMAAMAVANVIASLEGRPLPNPIPMAAAAG